MRLVLGVLLLSVAAWAGPITGTVDGVSYNLRSSEVGNGYVDYIYDFNALVSAYSIDVVWYGYPTDYQVIPTYGELTPSSADGTILYATLSGTLAGSPAAEQYGTDALPSLTLKFQSPSTFQFPYPSLTFTELVDPPATVSIASTPEPATVILTALALFAFGLYRRWLTRRNKPASI